MSNRKVRTAVIDSSLSKVYFELNDNAYLHKMMDFYSCRQGYRRSDECELKYGMTFRYNGTVINEFDTFKTLGISNNKILVFVDI